MSNQINQKQKNLYDEECYDYHSAVSPSLLYHVKTADTGGLLSGHGPGGEVSIDTGNSYLDPEH